jgi:hypothetical protein
MKRVVEFSDELRCKEVSESGKFLNHRVDISGNRFINGKCVNPTKQDNIEIVDMPDPVQNPLPTVIIS